VGFLGAAIGGIGSLLGGLFGSNASGTASKQYIQALQQAQGSLTNTENQGLAQFSPYTTSGGQANSNLSAMLGTPGQGLLTPWTQQFTAPTAAQAEQMPGYQFQLQQGEDAIQNSAAAQGGLLTGRTGAALNNYAQGTASTDYNNLFNQSLTQYQSAYNTFLNNQNNTYSRLAQQAGQGLSAAGGGAGLISGIGGDIASLYGAQGAAKAGGTIGSANAWGNAIGGLTNSFGSLANMNPWSSSGGPTAGTFQAGGGNPFSGAPFISSLDTSMQLPSTLQ
jgi:hypothetical protein